MATGKQSIVFRENRVLSLLALALLLSAWGVECKGRDQATQLASARFGQCTEVFEALARDAFVAQQLRPYFVVAFTLDWVAFVVLICQAAWGSFRLLAASATFVWLGSMVWHGLALAITSFGV